MSNSEGAQSMLSKAEAYQAMLEREAAMKEEILARQASEAANNSSQVEALVETIYLVAAADGHFSSSECEELSAHVAALTSGRFNAGEIETMRGRAQERAGEGIDARAQAIAECLTDMDLRRSALLAASSAAWKDGGVGQKEGLALQTFARAFGVPIHDLHKIMSEAHG